jgi:hypothetical protein
VISTNDRHKRALLNLGLKCGVVAEPPPHISFPNLAMPILLMS